MPQVTDSQQEPGRKEGGFFPRPLLRTSLHSQEAHSQGISPLSNFNQWRSRKAERQTPNILQADAQEGLRTRWLRRESENVQSLPCHQTGPSPTPRGRAKKKVLLLPSGSLPKPTRRLKMGQEFMRCNPTFHIMDGVV